MIYSWRTTYPFFEAVIFIRFQRAETMGVEELPDLISKEIAGMGEC